MSWRASAYVKRLRDCPNGERITRNEKFVALILADSHQDRGRSYTFPSVTAIAEDALMSERECKRVLASLELKGVIERVRPDVQYRGVTTFYRFPKLDEEGGHSVTLKPHKEGGQTDTLPEYKEGGQAVTLKGDGRGAGRVTEGGQKPNPPDPYKEEQEQEHIKPIGEPTLFSEDDPAFQSRILCEKLGVFDMREQRGVHLLMESFARRSGRRMSEAADHIHSRWCEYQAAMPKLNYPKGSAYRFLMSGTWDTPDVWPWKDSSNPTATKIKFSSGGTVAHA